MEVYTAQYTQTRTRIPTKYFIKCFFDAHNKRYFIYKAVVITELTFSKSCLLLFSSFVGHHPYRSLQPLLKVSHTICIHIYMHVTIKGGECMKKKKKKSVTIDSISAFPICVYACVQHRLQLLRVSLCSF